MSELGKHAQAMQSSKQSKPSVTASGTGVDNTQVLSTNIRTDLCPVDPGSASAIDVEACQLAEAMWSKFGPVRLMPSASKPSFVRFSQLVSQLRLHEMVAKLADSLQVNA